jgi:hypothetical protein
MTKQCSKKSLEGLPVVVLQCVVDISNLSKLRKMMVVFEAPCHQFNAESGNKSCSSKEFDGGDDDSLRFQFWHLELSKT